MNLHNVTLWLRSGTKLQFRTDPEAARAWRGVLQGDTRRCLIAGAQGGYLEVLSEEIAAIEITPNPGEA